MADFNVRSDSVNVEQIMEQIRARIREKRGVDYTEQQIRELAAVKLEKFLDPRGVRSDLLEQFRRTQPAYEPPELPNFAFEDATLFESHRGAIRSIRKLLLPILKLFFNPNPLIQALHIQSRLNTMNAQREATREATRRQMDQLYYELIHNLVIETTRLGIEVKNLKMRVESLSSRLEFNERRARALESVVVYKPMSDEAPQPVRAAAPQYQQPQQRPSTPQSQPPRGLQPPAAPAPQPTPAAAPAGAQGQPQAGGAPAEGPGQRSRRRRRRRGRRGGGSAAAIMAAPGSPPRPVAPQNAPDAGEAAAQIDALERMDDDGGPDDEESRVGFSEPAQQQPHGESAGSPRAETVASDTAPADAAPQTPQPSAPGSSDPDAQ
jgi:hypothetical protein